MFDLLDQSTDTSVSNSKSPNTAAILNWRYAVTKKLFDFSISAALIVPCAVVALALLVLNRPFNRGPLIYSQDRMGKNCRPFRAYKFRTMVESDEETRGPFDSLENSRITRLGSFLRKTRIDELPQIINVFRGEMSLIGPRPDALAHAEVYVVTVPGYRERHAVLPGISGFAQVEVGYVDGLEGINRKVAADHDYLRKISIGLDLWIAWRTLQVVFLRKGA